MKVYSVVYQLPATREFIQQPMINELSSSYLLIFPFRTYFAIVIFIMHIYFYFNRLHFVGKRYLRSLWLLLNPSPLSVKLFRKNDICGIKKKSEMWY